MQGGFLDLPFIKAIPKMVGVGISHIQKATQ